MPAKRPASSLSGPNKRPKPTTKRKQRTDKSVWNSKDDWDTLVAESSLSTSSVSLRKPRFRSFPSLTNISVDVIVRSFKAFYGDGQAGQDEAVADEWRKWWRTEWAEIPGHLKEMVRDGIYKRWGAILSLQLLRELFSIPPTLYLPGDLLPAIAQASRLKPLIPPTISSNLFMSLILINSLTSTDVGLAGLIHHLPSIEIVNLKGCALAGEKTVKTIVSRCPGVKRLNLKGTKVSEKDVAQLLATFGQQLEGFKVDNVIFNDIDHTFASQPYPSMTHLCLPGNMLNRPLSSARSNATRFTGMGYPNPRPTPQTTTISWPTLDTSFPSLTHLCLPGLLVPNGTEIGTAGLSLIKLALGPRGPPVPITSIEPIIKRHHNTLRSVHLGNVYPRGTKPGPDFDELAETIQSCDGLDTLRWQTDVHGTNDSLCDTSMSNYGHKLYWNLFETPLTVAQRVTLELPGQYKFPSAWSSGSTSQTFPSLLESLEIPSATLQDHESLAKLLCCYPKLRELDLSGTTIDDDDMKLILRHCPLISRIDLTSCRGVNVRHRRNIFKAFDEDES
ncbi:hypothetical protein L198_01859 [Cryptococcus wingfieldii CBS 7118]|uniref:RNI-like protein n=1 Tax=Cryptococcus wingfieldii CBS 7118 TaxID=1295528 RepID=A0A1E3JWD2_9TREE|nr:hypothetical protein L198_01859 [Cryptococcus wingfieldii CBS 7118]ODO05171.1 hypothetical protein L198_01859 [Cryptococcus wingfieldii CBS 7118]